MEPGRGAHAKTPGGDDSGYIRRNESVFVEALRELRRCPQPFPDRR